MRWTKLLVMLGVAAGFCWPLAISSAVPEQLTVYTEKANYSLPVMEREGKPYISLADLLSPLGASAPTVKGKEWRVQLNKAEVRLTEGKNKAVIRGNQFDLDGKVLVENQRVLVPMVAALPLLTRLLNVSVDLHQPSRRLFVGNVSAHFTASYKDGDSPSLTLNFSQPVHPDGERDEVRNGVFLTHSNRTTLIFKKEPLVSDTDKQQFGDGAIQSLAFSEENGKALLTVTGNAHLNIVRSDDGKTITLQPVAPVASASPAQEQSTPATTDNQRHGQEFFVMIDPSHGGYDKGANFGGKLLEKDVTLKLARELRKELDDLGIPSRMLRDSDVDVPMERRAEITNEQRAGIYIALHAGLPGHGVRVYTSVLTDPQQVAAGRFLPWESAQSAALDRSKAVGQAVTSELRKKGMTVAALGLPIRPLNNIIVPAIAVELAPEGDDLQSLESSKRNAGIVAAIAMGIAQVRGQIGARP
ncbi:MAG TPA: N-acetylmuramoyl-L-alanine amidase [Candidatus Angelobacter sp.]|nr:N-acetylmuramoyl-L-alanine amidase [Candidatus Angelobacter sp.]